METDDAAVSPPAVGTSTLQVDLRPLLQAISLRVKSLESRMDEDDLPQTPGHAPIELPEHLVALVEEVRVAHESFEGS